MQRRTQNKKREDRVEHKKVNILFVLLLVFFLAVTYILIRDLNENRAADYKDFTVTLAKIVRQKNTHIRDLSQQMMALRQENADLKDTLAQTKSAIDNLSQKLGPSSPAPAH